MKGHKLKHVNGVNKPLDSSDSSNILLKLMNRELRSINTIKQFSEQKPQPSTPSEIAFLNEMLRTFELHFNGRVPTSTEMRKKGLKKFLDKFGYIRCIAFSGARPLTPKEKILYSLGIYDYISKYTNENVKKILLKIAEIKQINPNELKGKDLNEFNFKTISKRLIFWKNKLKFIKKPRNLYDSFKIKYKFGRCIDWKKSPELIEKIVNYVYEKTGKTVFELMTPDWAKMGFRSIADDYGIFQDLVKNNISLYKRQVALSPPPKNIYEEYRYFYCDLKHRHNKKSPEVPDMLDFVLLKTGKTVFELTREDLISMHLQFLLKWEHSEYYSTDLTHLIKILEKNPKSYRKHVFVFKYKNKPVSEEVRRLFEYKPLTSDEVFKVSEKEIEHNLRQLQNEINKEKEDEENRKRKPHVPKFYNKQKPKY